MPTSFEQVEIQAMTYIKNDLSLNRDMATRLPVFYNRMLQYMNVGMAKFNRPPEMEFILANNTPPEFENIVYTAENETTAGTPIETGKSGYDIVSVGIVAEDAVGTPTYTPIAIQSYDAESGAVTLTIDLAGGQTVVIDFYKSGEFARTLTTRQIDLLAMCIYNAWEHRFDNNAIERISKNRDSSFTTISEASQTNAGTARLRQVDEELFDALRAYEQTEEYIHVVMKPRCPRY